MTARTAVVTGASSGIGAAAARALAADGWRVVIGARRVDRLEALAAETGAIARQLDVTDQASVDAFCAGLDACDLLVNNAGGALGTTSLADADIDEWQRMYDVNVLGTVRMTKALLPLLTAAPAGQVITIGSVAGHQPYAGGGGYNAAKHAEASFSRVLRLEGLADGLRVCEIAPGMVETEFSLVRFDGDTDRAASVYDGLTPLTADDVAETIRWVAARPAHVSIDRIDVFPQAQASAYHVHRRP